MSAPDARSMAMSPAMICRLTENRRASAAALELGEVAVETLRKGRNTEAQSGLDGDAARRANVLGAYTAVDAELVEGKRVLLIDDVITTGATISECARILRTVGAREVVCATLARARG